MAGRKGAIPRSGMTVRTPPQATASTPRANESIYLCQICLLEDGIEKIQCDKCLLWYHFTCAKLNKNVLKLDVYMCVNCVEKGPPPVQEGDLLEIESENPTGYSTITPQMEQILATQVLDNPTSADGRTIRGARKASSNASTVSRRAALALQRLEEERELLQLRDKEAQDRKRERDKEYLDQKYSILEDDVLSMLSYDDQELEPQKLESIRQWAENVHNPDSNNSQLKGDDEIGVILPLLNSTSANQELASENHKASSNVLIGHVKTIAQSRPGEPPRVSSKATASIERQEELPDWLKHPVVTEPGDNIPFWKRFSALHNPTQLPSGIASTGSATSHQQNGVRNHSHQQLMALDNQIGTMTHHQIPEVQSICSQSSNLAVDMTQQSLVGPTYQPWSDPASVSQSNQNVSRQSTIINPTTATNGTFSSQAHFGSKVMPSAAQSSYQPWGTNHQQVINPPTSMSVNQPQFSGPHQQRLGFSQPPVLCTSQPIVASQSLSTSQQSIQPSYFGFGRSIGQQYMSSGPLISQPTISQTQSLVANQRQMVFSQPINASQSLHNGHQYTTTQPPSMGHSNVNFSHAYSQPQSMATGQSFGNGHQYVGQSSMVNGNYMPVSQPLNMISSMNANNGIGQNNVMNQRVVPVRLTSDQIAARHVMPRDLPQFYGDPRQWYAFISAYENSNETCGFSNSENLGRLQKCLKGEAETAVKSRLFHKDSVPGVIETLRLLFGRPELILEAMLGDIHKLSAPKEDDLQALIKFAMSVQNLSATIQHVGASEHLRNPMLINSIVDKLPAMHRLNWAFYKQTIGNVHIGHLGDWLYQMADVASQVVRVSVKPAKKQESEKTNGYVNAQIEGSSKKNNAQYVKKCPVCNQKSCERIKDCKKFIGLDLKGRWALVKEKELCIRCFGYHRLKACRSKQKCNTGGCPRAHNSLLHDNVKSDGKTDASVKKPDKDDDVKVNCAHQSINRKVDIFRIAPVKLFCGEKSIDTFAYLDDGSNVTMMENDLANELMLESSSEGNLCVKWSFGKIRKEDLVSRRVSVAISGVHANAAKFNLHNVRTVEDLALPSQDVSQEWLDSYEHFKDIPITPYKNGKPRMLIGLQYSKLMVSRRTVEGKWSEPIACKTRLGWIVQGPDSDSDMDDMVRKYSLNICECQRNDSELHAMVKEFFSWDSLGVKITDKLLESKDVQRARKILESTTKKINDRYETGLLWRYDNVKFPETYPMALKRLECLERKMEKDPVLATKMCNYIQDFIEKRYVRKLTQQELQIQVPRVFYLPIFPVFNPKKPEKFRVVWDAAAMVNKSR